MQEKSKRDDIIEAATQLFLRDGFSAASINDIAQQAGVSKRTLYKYFRSKTDLFGAIILHTCEELMAGLNMSTQSDAAPQDVLKLFAKNYLDLVLSPIALDLRRTVIAEAKRFPELGHIFIKTGHERTVAALAQYLAGQHKMRTIVAPEPEALADQFLGLVLGSLRLKGYYDDTIVKQRRMLDRRIDLSVSLFLRGCSFVKTKPPRTRSPR